MRLLVIGLVLLGSGCASGPGLERDLALRVEAADFVPVSNAPEPLVLRVTGDAGQRFAGELVVDGRRQAVAGATPAVFPLEASVLVGDFQKQGGPGRLSFQIEGPSGSYGVGSLSGRSDHCRFSYHQRQVEIRIAR